MKLFSENETLHKNPDFRLEGEGRDYVFTHRSGSKVAADAVAQAIWDSLPGTWLEAARNAQARFAVSDDLIRDMVFLMRCADVVRSSPGPEPIEPSSRSDGALYPDLVSVVVVIYNGASHVFDCFQSLERQTYTNLEIIAVDNASRDETMAILASRFPRVKQLLQKKNLHYAAGVNAGIKSSRGKYILILNQDTEIADDCIARLHQKMTSGERIGAVAPMMKFFYLRGFVNGIGNQIWNHGWGTDNFIGHIDIGQFAKLEEVPSACFGAVFLRREALDDIGLLDEKFGSYYEDTDWSYRCWLRGWKIVPQAEAVVYHKFGGSYLAQPKLKLTVRNRLRFVLKIFQGKVMLGTLRRYMKEDLRNFLGLIKQRNLGFAMAYPKAYLSLALGLGNVILQRRRFRKHKLPTYRELDVLRKNIPFYHCLDYRGFPQLNISVMLGYYRWELAKMRPFDTLGGPPWK